jgi:LysM repeat protein
VNVVLSAATAWIVFGLMHPYEPLPLPTPSPTLDIVARLGSSVPTATATFPPSPTPVTYTVQPGDTLYEIALRLGIPLDALMAANGLTDPDALDVGQVLLVPSLEDLAQATATPGPVTAAAPSATAAIVGAPDVEIRGVDGMGDLARETVRLLNAGGVAAMAGWTLDDGGEHTFVFPAFTLYNGAVSIHTRAGENTVIDLYWGLSEAVWSSGKVITLREADGSVHSTFPIP